MDSLETTLLIILALVLSAVASYFAWRQRITWRTLRSELNLSRDQRRYLLRQVGRRLFGVFLLMLLAGLLIGAAFLDYEPLKVDRDNPDPVAVEASKQAARFPILYWMSILLTILVMLALAVLDLWATARFGVQQQKQLAQEHQHALEAELSEIRQRRAEMN